MLRRSMPLLLAVLTLALAALATSVPAHVAILGSLPIQDGGRVKPVSSFAREIGVRVAGARPFHGETVMGLDPVVWLFSMLADPDRWRREPIVRVDDASVQAALGVAAGRGYYTYAELAAPSGAERGPLALQEVLTRLEGLFSLADVRLVPRRDDMDATWSSLADMDHDPRLATLRTSRDGLFRAIREGNSGVLTAAAEEFATQLADTLPRETSSPRRLMWLEAHFYRVHPFRLAWVLYLTALVLFASRGANGGRIQRLAMAAALAGLLLHSYGIAIRVAIAGRAPVTNMFESVIWVGWGALVFALLLGRGVRARAFIECGVVTAMAALFIADSLPMQDRTIEPLIPVLHDNFWLTIHVLTISLAYAAFALGSCLAHVDVVTFALGKPGHESAARSTSVYRCLQLGLVLGIAGAFMGGWWASYAWGRFWGWDAKETSVFVALAFYLAILHARIVGWLGDRGTAVAAIFGFMIVLWSWYGVNFVLGIGLHTYGFGSGGYGLFAAVAIGELLFVALTSLLLRDRRPASPQADGTPAFHRPSIPSER